MEANFKHERINQYMRVCSNSFSREETAESVVPDIMPDIAKILDTDCSIFLREKNIQNGKASVEANIQTSILYLGEDCEGIYKLELSKPFSFTYENDEISENDILCVYLSVNNADTRILNPRKVLLRVDVCSELSFYRMAELSFPVDKDSNENLQILTKECPVQLITSVGEKAFSISDEFSFPVIHGDVEEIITSKAWAVIDETKTVGEKVILQGTINLKLLYKEKNEKLYKTEIFTTGFSQIMDCAQNSTGPNTVTLMPTSLNLELITGGHGSTSLLMEIHLTAQMICRIPYTLRYIADAYSLYSEEIVHKEQWEAYNAGETILLRDTVREVIDTTDTVKEVIYGYVQPGIPSVGERGLHIPLTARVIYRTESGNISSVFHRIQTELPCETLQGKELYLYPTRCQEGYFAPTTGGIEVRLPVEQRMELYDKKTIPLVMSVDVSEEDGKTNYNDPSLIVTRCSDTDLWALAKRYKTTTERIEHANKNTVEIGQLLLIPRPR